MEKRNNLNTVQTSTGAHKLEKNHANIARRKTNHTKIERSNMGKKVQLKTAFIELCHQAV